MAAAKQLTSPAVPWLVGGAGQESDDTGTPEPADLPDELNWRLNLARAQMALGRYRSAFRQWWYLAAYPLSAPLSLDAAEGYRELGWTSEALSIARRAVERGGARPSESDIGVLYPRPIVHEVEAAALRKDIETALLYSLIREESHFQVTATSPVGARGLMQLMDPTARDMMARIGREVPDITAPEANLALGTEYLEYLEELLPNRISVIAAYNAGLGRLREWNRSFGDLPVPLFIEAIPFTETRNYVRNVIRSYAAYRFLTDGDPPPVSLRWIINR
jgi:soluble lytic murein transglycosylase-like protein